MRLGEVTPFAAWARSRSRGMRHGPFGLNDPGQDPVQPGPHVGAVWTRSAPGGCPRPRALAETRSESCQDYKEGAAVWYAAVAGAD